MVEWLIQYQRLPSSFSFSLSLQVWEAGPLQRQGNKTAVKMKDPAKGLIFL
jgi:hypothetical protein